MATPPQRPGGRDGSRSSAARSTSAPTIAIFSPPSARAVAGCWRSIRRRKAVASAFSTTPLAEDSIGGVWGSTGVSIDARGNIYAVTGASGSQKHAPPLHNWAQSVLKFDPISASGLTLRGVYTPFNYCRTEAGDIDVGSSGAAILPDVDDKSGLRRSAARRGRQAGQRLSPWPIQFHGPRR